MPGLISRALGVPRPRNADITTSQELAERMKIGRQTWSGIDINPSNALSVSAVFACVRLIAEDIGKLPFPVYRRTADGRERAPESPFWRLLHDRPNGWQSSQEFREMLTAHALLRGNGFALKNTVRGQVRELIPLRPDRVRIEQTEDFELLYHVRLNASGPEETMTRREILHLRGISLDGVSGVGIVTLARQGIALSMAAERHGATFFGNGQHPSGVFKHPSELSDPAFDRLKASLDEQRGEGAGGTLILEDGMDWTQVGLSNEDSQFLESREFQVEEVARWFRAPPHKIAHLKRATFNNIEHLAIEYVTDTLMSWGKRWENAVNHTVIVTNEVYAELLFDALLRGDTKSRYEANRIAVGRPWKTPNEVRREDNMPELEGLDEVWEPPQAQGGNDRAEAEATNAA